MLTACGGGDPGTPAEAGKRPQAAVAPLGGSVPAARPLFGAIDAYARTDLNGDGRTDIVWVDATRGITATWLMNGSTLLGGGTLLQHPSYRVIGTGDLGGDGKSDLLWYDPVRDVTATWQMDGTRLAAGRELLLNQGFELIGTPDIDGDGKDDLLWYAERTGRLVVWRMDGTSRRSTLDLTYLVPISTTTRVVALPDLDGDGRTDLVLRDSATGATFAWLMNAAGGITPVPLFTHPDFRVTHAADMNGDGKSDLLWHNPVTGQTVVWLMDGANLIGGGEILADRNYRVLATPDLNGDGRADLLWTSVTQRQTVAWLMNGTTLLGGGVLPAAAGFEVVGIPDLDGDGRADLLWYDASTGQTAVWLMNGSAIGGGGTLLTDAMFRPLGAPSPESEDVGPIPSAEFATVPPPTFAQVIAAHRSITEANPSLPYDEAALARALFDEIRRLGPAVEGETPPLFDLATRLTPDEWKLVIRHPIEGVRAAATVRPSREAAVAQMPCDADVNFADGKADAVRHAYWSALISMRTSAAFAEDFTAAHESGAANNDERAMDLHNNAVGRRLAARFPSATDDQLLELLLQQPYTYVASGAAIPADTDGLIYISERARRPFDATFVGSMTNPDSGSPWTATFNFSQCGSVIRGNYRITRGQDMQERRFSGSVSGEYAIELNVSDPYVFENPSGLTPCIGVKASLTGSLTSQSGPWRATNCSLGGMVMIRR